MSNIERCSNCGKDAKIIRGTYHFKELSLKNVWLQGIELIHCDQCGNEDPIIRKLSDLMRLLARAVAHKPYRLQGYEIRFLRKFLEMNAEEFSRLLHVDKATLSKWENNEDPVGFQSDRLIRLVAMAKVPQLNKESRAVLENFEKINDTTQPERLEVDPAARSFQYA